MLRLTREVRFAVNGPADPQMHARPANGYGGFPTLTGFGPFLTLQVTLAGPLDPVSGYVVNIRQIDAAVRQRGIRVIAEAAADRATPATVLHRLYQVLDAWPPLSLEKLTLCLSPFLAYSICASERPMIRLSQKFEFSASHRLHNLHISEAENRRIFGKCNNPHGHGHNYEVQVTLAGPINADGLLIDIPEFERIVAAAVIDKFDHKHLNIEVPEFQTLIPTVENIAMTVYQMLEPKFADRQAKLASVKVWETPKTWCEYSR